MATVSKKKMKASLKADWHAEMDKKVKEWCESVPAFTKSFKPFIYEEFVELDPRKWSEAKLKKEVYAMARFDIQLFATAAHNMHKKVLKGGPKAQLDAEKNFPKALEKIQKQMANKLSMALDEMASDQGDNKKALRDGKAAMKRATGLDLKAIFKYPRNETVAAFNNLATALNKAGEDDAKQEQAFRVAADKVDAARKEFDKDCKDVEAALKYLIKLGKEHKDSKTAAPEVVNFAKTVDGHKSAFEGLDKDLENFEIDIDDAANDIKARKLTPTLAANKAKIFEKYKRLDASATGVLAILKKLKPAFTDLEKALK